MEEEWPEARPRGRFPLLKSIGAENGRIAWIFAYAGFKLSRPAVVRELRRQHNDITVRGRFMYPRETAARMVRLVRVGLIDPTHFDLIEFRLDGGNKAVAHASPLQLTVLLRTGVVA